MRGGNVAGALRALQKLDEVHDLGKHRYLLITAESALGAELGLSCTGVRRGGPYYSHDSDTCPIHEWLVESDAMRDDE